MLEETQPQATELSLRDYMDLLRRRKAIVIQTFMVVFVLGVAVTFMSKPVYRTSARILVESRSMTVSSYDVNNPLEALFAPDPGHDVLTQIEVLQGDVVQNNAYKDADVPVGSAHLDVRQVGLTDVIELIVESNVPTYAERFAKALPNTYLNYITNNHKDDVNTAYTFAQSRLKDEREKLADAELKLDRFKHNAGITELSNDISNKTEEQAAAQGELRAEQATEASLAAALTSMRNDLKTCPKTVETTTTASNDATIDAIQREIDSLNAEKAGLLIQFKETHPKVMAVDSQIKELQRQLAATPPTESHHVKVTNPALEAYTNKITDTQDQLTAIRAQIASVKDRLERANNGLANYSALERQQAELSREITLHSGEVTLLLKSVQDLDMRTRVNHDPISIIAPAGAAIQVAPKKLNNLIYASLVGLMLGLCFALLQEFLDDRINSPEDARRIVGTPALGYVPLIENEEARLLSGSRSGGSVLESYRVLRSNVRFAAVDSSIHSLLVTSTVPGEGKSVTAYNLAVAMALDGRSVILVDTDLRRPTMHEKAKVSQQPGLTNVLVGHTPIDDAIKTTNVPGLRVLSAGPLPPNPAELLNSQAMKQMHSELKARADIVIYDSPPCLATADAQVLAAETDGVLYVIQFGEAKKSAVRHAIEMLRQTRTRILGVVFNKIDLTAKRDAYYYGYYGYYGYYQTSQIEDGRPRRRRSTADFEALTSKDGVEAQESPERAAMGPAEKARFSATSHVYEDNDSDDESEEA